MAVFLVAVFGGGCIVWWPYCLVVVLFGGGCISGPYFVVAVLFDDCISGGRTFDGCIV